MTNDDDIEIRRGSDNVFADLGFADPDTHLLKAQLVDRVQAILRDRELTQTRAAEAVGMSQPDISRLLNGQFRDVSVERIMRILTRLGCEVDIMVTSRDGGGASVPIHYRPEAAVG